MNMDGVPMTRRILVINPNNNAAVSPAAPEPRMMRRLWRVVCDMGFPFCD